MMLKKYIFTVFTPTCNRAHTLHRVYESLKAQTFQNFEWLIIDDGSKDGTNELVETWQSDPDTWFSIRYIWQENDHKKTAHNRAVLESHGELFLVFDSDDQCIPETLERFWHHWSSIPEEHRDKFSGVCGLCIDQHGQVVGDRFPAEQYLDSDSLEIRYCYGVTGEKWGIMRTDVLRMFPFRADIPGYVPENTVWGQIATQYKTRFFNEALRIYYHDVQGIIARKGEVIDASRNALGSVYAKKIVLNDEIGYLFFAPKAFFLEAARLLRFWLHLTVSQKKILGLWPHSWLGKSLLICATPLGLAMYFLDRWRWWRKSRRTASNRVS
jgi:glycosyltransferase involved in cell wall biosynthesis